MKFLPEFEYLVPETLDEVSSLLHRYGKESRILAGGTDLLIGLKRNEVLPKVIIDIGRITELSASREEEGHIFIGATATHTKIAESELIKREASLLSEAASSVGSVQIRNSGTIGGNIANASPAADTVPPLIVLDAEAQVISQSGKRSIPLSALFSGPYQTALAPDEWLSGVRFPKLTSQSGTSFLKLGRRRALSVSRMTVAVVLALDMNGLIEQARICAGAVMPMPSRAEKAEEILIGLPPDSGLFERAGRLVAEKMVQMTGIRYSTPYKEPVVINLVQRALAVAAERCLVR